MDQILNWIHANLRHSYSLPHPKPSVNSSKDIFIISTYSFFSHALIFKRNKNIFITSLNFEFCFFMNIYGLWSSPQGHPAHWPLTIPWNSLLQENSSGRSYTNAYRVTSPVLRLFCLLTDLTLSTSPFYRWKHWGTVLVTCSRWQS